MYHVEIKIKNFTSKKNELLKHIRETLLLRGQCDEIHMWIHALNKFQVMWAELGDMYSEIIILNYEDERIKKVEIVLEKVGNEWSKFEEIIRSEIKEQLHVKLEVASSMSGKSRRINRSGSSEFFQLPSDREEDRKKIRTSANYHAKIEVPQTFPRHLFVTQLPPLYPLHKLKTR